MDKKNERELKYLYLGIGVFVTGFCTIRLMMHYWFGYIIEGNSRKFGDYNEDLYWLFLVIGVIWLIFASISFYRYRHESKKSN